jgi:hypothetical protein
MVSLLSSFDITTLSPEAYTDIYVFQILHIFSYHRHVEWICILYPYIK